MRKTFFLLLGSLLTGLLLTAATPSYGPPAADAWTPAQVPRYGAPSYGVGGPGGGRMKPPHYLGVPLWSESAVPFATGGSMTQDGRLLFYTAYETPHHPLARGIFVAAMHPERATTDPADGLPDLSQVFDEPIRILDQSDPNRIVNDGTFGLYNNGFMAVVFDPDVEVDGQTPPWRVDCVSYAPDPGGACRRYDLQVVLNVVRRMDKDQGVGWNVPVTGGKPVSPEGASCLSPIVSGGPLTYAPAGRGLESNTCDGGPGETCFQVCSDTTQTLDVPAVDSISAFLFQQRKLRLFVDAQGTLIDGATGQDPHPQWTDHGAARTFSFSHRDNPIPLQGIEPVLTADGRIMVWQSVSTVYDADELGQQGGACWSYTDPALGAVPRAACGVGRNHERPTGVCPPGSQHAGYPNGCAPSPQCLSGAPGPGGGACGNQVPYFHHQNVVYSFRHDPADPHGWSQPRNLADLYATHGAGAGANEPAVDGVAFSERYGLGRFPVTHGDGSAVDAVRGQYYWLDPDGDWLLWNGIGHAATSIVGASTQGRMINLDGPINPSDYNLHIDPGPCNGQGNPPASCSNVSRFNWTDRENFFAWGVSPGMWGPHLARPALPYRQSGERSLVMLGQQLNSYHELALHEDPDRILFLHMNKALRFLPDWPRDFHNKARHITHSPHAPAPNCDPPGPALGCGAWGPYTDDATGNGHTGTLVGVDAVVFDSDDYLNAPKIADCDAAHLNGGYCNRWYLDYGNREHEGFNGPRSGQSIRFYGTGGYVQVGGNTPRLNPSGGAFDAGFSAGLFVRAIQAGGARTLLEKDQSFKLSLEADGTVSAQLWLDDATAPVLSSDGPITAYQVPGGPSPSGMPFWNHLAVTAGYDGTNTHLRLYVDGQLLDGRTRSGQVRVVSSASDLFIGKAPAGASAPSDVAIDEVELWSTERSAAEVAAMAYVAPPPSTLRAHASSQFPGLPLGLDASFLKLPEGREYDLTPGRVALGRRLFHDPAFSRSQDMACATCHEATHFFAQHPASGSLGGFSTSRGGPPLPRQTPFLVNRAFSTDQLWDARSGSLEEQVLLPLFSADEMAARSVPHVEWLLQTNYGAAFQAEYGTAAPTIAELQLALAAYERNLVAGGSAVDLYLAGLGGLSQAERDGLELFFGKARCSACHFGPNFTDERLHVTVADMSSNPGEGGAFDVTGRAADWRRFKTPSLRTGGQTERFFHNGSAATLFDVVQQYNGATVLHTGGPAGSFERDPEIRPLGLTTAEILDLVAFLQALESPVSEIHP